MKNLLWSIMGGILAAMLILSFMSNTFSAPTPPSETIWLSQRSEMAAIPHLRMQVAHLRTIDPGDIRVVPTSRPVPGGYPLGSVFGMRRHPILGVNKMHTGIDFPAPVGTPVLATATGKVQKVVKRQAFSSYGKHIILAHDERFSTLYAHLSEIRVSADEIVEEGDTIGYVGTSGRSTNPHLHYEVIRDGLRVNPEQYF